MPIRHVSPISCSIQANPVFADTWVRPVTSFTLLPPKNGFDEFGSPSANALSIAADNVASRTAVARRASSSGSLSPIDEQVTGLYTTIASNRGVGCSDVSSFKRNVPSEHGSHRLEQPVGYPQTFTPFSTLRSSLSTTTPSVFRREWGGASGRGPSRESAGPTAVKVLIPSSPACRHLLARPGCPGGRELAGRAPVGRDPVARLSGRQPCHVAETLPEVLEVVRRVEHAVSDDAELERSGVDAHEGAFGEQRPLHRVREPVDRSRPGLCGVGELVVAGREV